METQTPYNAGGKPNVVIQISADTTFSCLCHLAGIASGVTPQEKAANARALMEACMDEYKKIVSVEIKAALQPPKRPSAEEIYLPPLPPDRHDKAVADARNMIANIKSAALAQEGEQDFKQITDSVLEKLRADYDLCPTIQMLGVDSEGAFIWMAVAAERHKPHPAFLFIYKDAECMDASPFVFAASAAGEKIDGTVASLSSAGILSPPVPELSEFKAAVIKFVEQTNIRNAASKGNAILTDLVNTEKQQDLTRTTPAPKDFKQITDGVLEKLRADYDLCPTIQMLGVDSEGAFIWMAAGIKHGQTRPLYLFVYRDDALDGRSVALIAYNKTTNINARYRIEKISESACKKFGLVVLPDLEDMPDLTEFSDAVHTYADATSDAFLRKRLSSADEGKQDLDPVPSDDAALWNTIREGIRGTIERRRFCRAVFVVGEVDGKIIWMAAVRLYPQKVKRQGFGVMTFNGSKHFAYCPISDSQNIVAEIIKIRNQYNITSPMTSTDLFIKEVKKFAAIPVLPEMSDDEAVELVDTCYGLWHTPKAF